MRRAHPDQKEVIAAHFIDRVADNPIAANAARIADDLRKHYSEQDIVDGVSTMIDGLRVMWVIDAGAPADKVEMISSDGGYRLRLTRLGETSVYAGHDVLPAGTGFWGNYSIDGVQRNGVPVEVYVQPEENRPHDGSPKGMLQEMESWHSSVFPGTSRKWSIYVPAQLPAGELPRLMVFQDGSEMIGWGIPTTLDNLIAKGDIPPCVGVFIDPGSFDNGELNRGFEYDALSDRYVQMILDEILPMAGKVVRFSSDPDGRAAMGCSSGGICSWTMAWRRPDQFGKVVSWLGSYTNMTCADTETFKIPNYRMAPDDEPFAGGHNYPYLVRRADRKPIRIFLVGNENDVDWIWGNWPSANRAMESALRFKGYDFRSAWGNGFHTPGFGMSILPDTLRWLWRR